MAKTFTVTITDETWAGIQEHLKGIHTEHDEATMTDARMEIYLSNVIEHKMKANVMNSKIQAVINA